MQDYSVTSVAQVAGATSSGTAVLADTLTAETKAVCLDNGFNVDMVAMVGTCKLAYIRAGGSMTLDLKADSSSIGSSAATVGIPISLYAPNGSSPTTVDATSIFLIHCKL